ncbi:MAG: hypothetical protein KPEEDBHJ_00209 [Anaerolineales bacterium]|nr:hypothetical protein [Anaerolineales bacterium]
MQDITGIEEITPTWLTEAFQKAGHLTSGSIENVVFQSDSDIPVGTPKIYKAVIAYSKDAVCDIPSDIIFKFALQEKEYYFYESIAKLLPQRFVPNCYLALQNVGKSQSLLLIENLSKTHTQTEWPVVPNFNDCKQAVEKLATLHAYWWNRPDLDTDLLPMLTHGNYWSGRLAEAVEKLPAFLDFIGDRLSSARRKMYEKVLNSSNLFWRPECFRFSRTFLHGDAHFWNFLFPNHKSQAGIQIIDWNSWDIGRGTNDLAYMIGLHWYPGLRQQSEKSLLKIYHETITNAGISYSWDECWLDYRESNIMNLFIPIWQWQRNSPAMVWWSHLERSHLTFDDLDCEELL